MPAGRAPPSAGAAGEVSASVPSAALPGGATVAEPREPGPLGFEHLRLRGRSVVVGGGHQRGGVTHLDHDDRLDTSGQLRAVRAHEFDTLGEAGRSGLVDHRRALEPVALARERVDYVDRYRGPGRDVGGGLRRADVREEQVVVVPHPGRSPRGEVRRAIRADSRVERELLLLDQPLHVIGEYPHYRLPPVSAPAHGTVSSVTVLAVALALLAPYAELLA